jgi:UDP-N-acetylglucosamine diphosphorylase/glucosamine-1-phosphate N-acetyltransferase
MQDLSLAIIILAAGKGKRMGMTDKPKVMAEISGIPLIGHVIKAVLPLSPISIIPIIGFQREIVSSFIEHYNNPTISCIVQEEQLGTGHAVNQAAHIFNDFSGYILILTGDTPLIKTSTLQTFINNFRTFPVDLAAATLSSFTSNPFGYGRIVRSEHGDFIGIIEEKDATDDQKKIEEINTGIFLVQSNKLFSALNKISNTNAQNEYYLTDIIKILICQGENVAAIPSRSFIEFQGINTLEELQLAQSTYNTLQE